MRGEVLGIERRRRWSDDEKFSIVSSVGIAGTTVTQIAQRHEVTRQQIYAWRHDLKQKGLWSPARILDQGLDQNTVFLPVDFQAAEMAPSASSSQAHIELRMVGGRCLRFNTAIDMAVLTRLIKAVEAA